MTWTTFALLMAIQFVLAGGDVFAKRQQSWAAMLLWLVGCALWVPTMRAPGFTRLIVAADALGMIVIMLAGRLFLNEILSARQWCGIVLAFGALIAMWEP